MRRRGSITFTSEEGITIPIEEYIEKMESEETSKEIRGILSQEIAHHKQNNPHYHSVNGKRRPERKRVYSTKIFTKREVRMENTRRGTTANHTIKAIDAICREIPREKGFTAREVAEHIGVEPKVLSGQISILFQALDLAGKAIREKDGMAYRIYLQEDVTPEEAYELYRDRAAERFKKAKIEPEPKPATKSQKTSEQLTQEGVGAMENLIKAMKYEMAQSRSLIPSNITVTVNVNFSWGRRGE